MIDRLTRWLRLVAPPEWVLVTLAAGWLICEGLYWLVARNFADALDAAEFFRPRDFLVVLAAALCGMLRVAAKHPALDRAYFNWLLATPWQRGQPLPLGPVHLVLQDMLVVGGLTALTLHQPTVSPLVVPLAFLCAYLLQLAGVLWYTGQVWTAYGLVFWLGVVVKLAAIWPAAGLAAATLAYLPALAALWRSLAEFPWFAQLTWAMQFWLRQTAPLKGSVPQGADSLSELPELRSLWPYGALHHRRGERLIEPREAVALSLLVGWWSYVLWSFARESDDLRSISVTLVFVAGLVCGGARLLRFVLGHASPISLWGRICTLQWIVPRYDQVVLTPLAGMAAAIVLLSLCHVLGLSSAATLGLGLAAVLSINLLGPPRHRQWQLTAPLRLYPPQFAKGPGAAVEEI